MSQADRCQLFDRKGAALIERGEPLDEHFDQCSDCRLARSKYTRIVAAMKLLGETPQPPPGLEERVLARLKKARDAATTQKPEARGSAPERRAEPTPRLQHDTDDGKAIVAAPRAGLRAALTPPRPSRGPATSGPRSDASKRRLVRPGDKLDAKYVLVQKIGEGSTCSVWSADNELTSRRVAIKLLLNPTEKHKTKLLRQAHAHGFLCHRNIADVVDVGQTALGELFLVMTMLRGQTLASLLGQQRWMELREVLHVGRAIAAALVAAHAVDIRHGNLTPSSIFLHEEDGSYAPVVRVLGFHVGEPTTPTSWVTPHANDIAASSRSGHDPTVLTTNRTDVFSLGIILFAMLTGRHLREMPALEAPAVLLAHMKAHPARNAVESDLYWILERCFDTGPFAGRVSASEIVKMLSVTLETYEPPRQNVPPVFVPSLPGGAPSAWHAAPRPSMTIQMMPSLRTAKMPANPPDALTAKLGTPRDWASLPTTCSKRSDPPSELRSE